MKNQILKLPEVIRQTGISRSSIYRLLHDNQFPAPITLSERSIGWLSSEIEDWLTEKMDQRVKTKIKNNTLEK